MVFNRLSHLAPSLVIYAFAELAFPDIVSVQNAIRRVAVAYMIIVTAIVIDAFLNAVVAIYGTSSVAKSRPIKSYVQVAKIFVYLITIVLVITTLLDRSPWAFLSGLGALTAVIMLLFKDTILGFVASIQLVSYDMVRQGDWIEMPKYGADGDVIDVTLNTVKVQNWDKTISTIPTYALVSDTFRNWRGMKESGGRRIKRAIVIDLNTIHFCSEEMLDRFEKVRLISDYIKQKRVELKAHNEKYSIGSDVAVNVRRLTNIGTFRAYVVAYLKQHPKVHQNMTFMVRQLPPSEKGLPMEIYVFSNDQAWVNYEGIQADIFDHLLAVVPEFGLRVYQNPSGEDVRAALASVSRGG
jgi:miniconductance mechanosensitive channel